MEPFQALSSDVSPLLSLGEESRFWGTQRVLRLWRRGAGLSPTLPMWPLCEVLILMPLHPPQPSHGSGCQVQDLSIYPHPQQNHDPSPGPLALSAPLGPPGVSRTFPWSTLNTTALVTQRPWLDAILSPGPCWLLLRVQIPVLRGPTDLSRSHDDSFGLHVPDSEFLSGDSQLQRPSPLHWVCSQLSVMFRLFTTPWIVAHQAPLSMGLSQQETGMGCHSLLHGIFSTQASNLRFL